MLFHDWLFHLVKLFQGSSTLKLVRALHFFLFSNNILLWICHIYFHALVNTYLSLNFWLLKLMSEKFLFLFVFLLIPTTGCLFQHHLSNSRTTGCLTIQFNSNTIWSLLPIPQVKGLSPTILPPLQDAVCKSPPTCSDWR